MKLNLPPSIRHAYARQLCMVCGVALGDNQGRTSHACSRQLCQHHYQNIYRSRHLHQHLITGKIGHDIPRCNICSWPLTPDEAALAPAGKLATNSASCSDPSCLQATRQREAEQQHQLKLMRCRIEEQRQKWLAELTLNLEEKRNKVIVDADEWPLIMFPGNSRSLQPLPDVRHTAYREHLVKIIQQALTQPPPESDEEPPGSGEEKPGTQYSAITAAACQLCKGNCCMAAGNHAYLNTDVIHNYLNAFPEATAEEIEIAFIARLPMQVYEDSCIYHGESGCGLGEWRSHTCRQHYCEPLKDALAQGITTAWGVTLTSGEPHWTRWPWPRQDDEVLDWGGLS